MCVADTDALQITIVDFLQSNFPVARQKHVTPEDLLLKQGIIDSLGLLTIISFLEDEFAVTVHDGDVVQENFGSIAAMVTYVLRKCEEKQRSPETQG